MRLVGDANRPAKLKPIRIVQSSAMCLHSTWDADASTVIVMCKGTAAPRTQGLLTKGHVQLSCDAYRLLLNHMLDMASLVLPDIVIWREDGRLAYCTCCGTQYQPQLRS